MSEEARSELRSSGASTFWELAFRGVNADEAVAAIRLADDMRVVFNQFKRALDNFETQVRVAEMGAQPSIQGQSIDILDLSPRGLKCMKKLGIKTIGELLRRNELDLRECRGTGKVTLSEIKTALALQGLKLRGDY